MNQEHTVLQHDLLIMEEMAANMAAYLVSDTLDWRIPRVNMPRLTVGGYLMREQRLLALKKQLDAEEQGRYEAARKQFEDALVERVVRFETKTHQELHARLGEWIAFLRDLNSRMVAEPNHYAGVVDTRVVIHAMIDRLQQRPYQLETQIVTELNTLDRKLRLRWTPGPFVWDAVWKPAYPADEYWYLHGCPRVE